jgi:hypothetical protein
MKQGGESLATSSPLINIAGDARLSHIGSSSTVVASDLQLGRAREDHHCDGL